MLERLFKLSKNKTNAKTEIMAGITTFMTMAYILAVNPSILADAGMNSSAVLLATAIASFIATCCMAFMANLPFVLSAGMGLNAYLAYTVVLGFGYSWQLALLAVFAEGIIFIILSLTNVREAIFNAIPLTLKRGVSVGIGLFIAFIGLQNCGLVVDSSTLVTITSFTDKFSTHGICALLETSPLLGCMAMGTVYINLTDDERLFRQVAYFNPPILMLFFVRSGVSFDFHSLFARSASIGSHSLLVIGVGYFVARIVGKYGGAMLGSRFVGANNSIRRYLGLALIPQAGVAIGLSELGARTLGGEPGVALQTIILASSILYELIGPPSAKGALLLSGSCETDGDATDGDTTEGIAEGEPAVEDASGARTSAVKPKTEDSGGYDLPDEKADEHVFSEEADRFYEDSADSGHHKKHKKHKKDKEKDKEKDKKKHKKEK